MSNIDYQTARELVDMGFPIFPVNLTWDKKDKKFQKTPAVKWKVFQSRLPSDLELHEWFDSSKYNGIGLATGKLLGAVVVDVEAISKESDRRGLDSTLVVQTISGGWHFYYKWEEEIRNTVKIRDMAIDFRGDGGYVVIPPSNCQGKSYSWLKRSPITNLPLLPESLFKDFISEPVKGEKTKPLDVRDYINVNEGSRDDKTYRLACSLLQKHSEEEAWVLLLATAKSYEGFGVSFTEEDARAKYRGAYDFIKKEKRLFSQRLDESKTKKKSIKGKDKNITYTSYFETDEYILEEVRSKSNPEGNANIANQANSSHTGLTSLKFLKYSKRNRVLSLVDEVTEGEKIIRPISTKLAETGIVNLPEISSIPDIYQFAEFAELAPLISDIRDFFDKFFEVPDFERKFLPYYVLFTWVYEKFPFVPYLQLVGLTGTGKTRTGETVAGVCYKSIDVRGSASISAIFRIADEWKGTLFIDEFDMDSFGKDNYGAALAFLKSGVGDGSVLRVEGANKRTVEAYSVKSPKIFTSEKPINDAGLQSRTYVIEMETSTKKLPLFKIKDKYEQKLNELRTRLLYWRLNNLNKINLADIEWGYPELGSFDKRVQQVITPVYYLADEVSRQGILKFAIEQEEATFNERREAISGIVFDVIKESCNDEPEFSAIFESVKNRLTSDGLKLITNKSFGKILKVNLHFSTGKRGHDNVTKIFWDKDKFDAMLKYYGYAGTDIKSEIEL